MECPDGIFGDFKPDGFNEDCVGMIRETLPYRSPRRNFKERCSLCGVNPDCKERQEHTGGKRSGRIYRFDHARALISPSFSITASNILFRFLWRIVHPFPAPLYGDVLPKPKLVGLDATVTKLTEEDETWLRDTLMNQHGYKAKLANERVGQSKKVVAMYMPPNGDRTAQPVPKWCYTIGKPLSHSSGLFSRATKVVKVLFREDPSHFFAVKDSWRHVYRQNEIDFYNHVRNRYGSDYPRGLARGIGAIDFGLDPRFPWHRTNSHETSAAKDALASGQARQDEEPMGSDAPTPAVSAAVDSRAQDALFPLQLPQTEIRKPGDVDLNRTLTRTTTYPVGEPIVEFKSTKQLIEGIRDAIEGHRALMECGLLHRDVSGSNVLLTTSGQSKGFLHDLDYSTYVREWDKFAGQGQGDDDQLCAYSSNIARELKEITGTYQFLARDILDGGSHSPKHDLESFFWLLCWIFFRHVDHGGTMNGVKDVLDTPSANLAKLAKSGWLHYTAKGNIVNVTGNDPLGQLYHGLVCLLFPDDSGMVHDEVLRVFGDALDCQGWPGHDGSRIYKPSKANPYYSSLENTRSSKRKAEHEPEDQFGSGWARAEDPPYYSSIAIRSSKRKAENEPEEQPGPSRARRDD
ncbi:hypothetical protein F5887DRAFT_937775 [Amanita rubescens]|nr:hypothetical protein F5887DRAFT_937775 [Amanita rubescens]